MKKTLLTAATVLMGAVVLISPQQALAADDINIDQNQEINQNVDVECDIDAGAYGQDIRCDIDVDQSAEQYQSVVLGDTIYKEGRVYNLRHEVIGAGLDTPMLALTGSTILAGITAAAYQLKSRLS